MVSVRKSHQNLTTSFQHWLDELDLSDDWIESAFDVFLQARQKITLFDDVEPVLDALINTYQLVSLTNGNANTIETGVDHWFDFVLNSKSVGKMKSEPDIYQQMQKLTNIEAKHMMHIGDHPVQDILGAKSAGVFSVWLNRSNKSWPLDDCQPDAVIHSLHELPVLLAQLTDNS